MEERDRKGHQSHWKKIFVKFNIDEQILSNFILHCVAFPQKLCHKNGQDKLSSSDRQLSPVDGNKFRSFSRVLAGSGSVDALST